MNDHPHDWPLVVGSADAQEAALRYGIERARAVGRHLRVVHAWHVPPSGMHSVYTPDIEEGFRTAGAAVLADCRDLLRTIEPRATVDFVLTYGHAPKVLLDESMRAYEVVVGPDDAPWFVRLFEGRTAKSLARGAACPVVVVPEGWDERRRSGAVFVVLDGPLDSHGPLDYAFHAALHGRRSIKVIDVVPDDLDGTARSHRSHDMRNLVDAWAERFPEIRVARHMVSGDVVDATQRERGTASLMVAGRPRPARPTLFHRPYTQDLIRASSCPVAVIPADYRRD